MASGNKFPLENFINPRIATYTKANDRSQAELDYQRDLEPYKLGQKEWKVRIVNTNRVNSILKITGLNWQRLSGSAFGVPSPTGLYRVGYVRDNRRYDYATRQYVPYKEDMVVVFGQLHCFERHRTRTPFQLVLDDGTDVTKSIPRNAEFEVLLDCKEPTILYEPDAGLEQHFFVDRFGEKIKKKDMVVFMSNETLKIGNVVRFFPRGGMSIKTIEGHECKVMNPHVLTVMKIDSKLPDRVMIAKLSGGK